VLTAEQLQVIMPDLEAVKRDRLFPFLTAAITEFAIAPAGRTAAFLAQLAHESGQLQFMEEIWGPTLAQRRYEPPGRLAADLGNIEPGDGRRFKGRGPIQITGRANYQRYGELLGIDLLADPARAALPNMAFRIAGLFWSRNGLNELADEGTADAFRKITKRINGGLNGLAERQRFYSVARTVLGLTKRAMTRRRRAVPFSPRELRPAFERGREAIRADARRRTRRKDAL
jgi:predicted chitinase